RVSLRLRHLGHVNDSGDVLAAGTLGRDLVDVAARDVVVALYGIQLDARALALPAEALEYGGDRGLRRLKLVRHRDPIAVVPHRDDQRDLQDSRGVQALPEHTLAGPRVPDRREADLLAAAREAARDRSRGRRLAVEPRCPRQAHRTRPMRSQGGELRRGLLRRV